MIGQLTVRISHLWNHTGFQRYFRNTSWMFIAQSTSIISLAVNLWLARYLGPDNYGSLSYVLAFGGFFSFICSLGINDILVRDLIKYPEKRDIYLGTSAVLLMLGGIVASLCTATAAFLFEPPGIIRSLIIVYATIFLFSASSVISLFFQAKVEAKKNAVNQIINTTIISCIKIFLILSGKGIIWILGVFVLDALFASLLCIYQYKASKLRFSDWSFNWSLAKTILAKSHWLMFSVAMSYLLLRIDQVMLKHYLDTVSVGLYAAAIKLVEMWYFIPGIISASIFPAIVNAQTVHHELYFSRLKRLLAFLVITGSILALMISFFAPFIIKILYGTAYAQSVPVLQTYAWSGVGLFFNIGLTKYLLAENRLISIFNLNFLAVILNILLNAILIPKIGLTGAAWATLISYTIAALFGLGLLHRDHKKARLMA